MHHELTQKFLSLEALDMELILAAENHNEDLFAPVLVKRAQVLENLSHVMQSQDFAMQKFNDEELQFLRAKMELASSRQKRMNSIFTQLKEKLRETQIEFKRKQAIKSPYLKKVPKKRIKI